VSLRKQSLRELRSRSSARRAAPSAPRIDNPREWGRFSPPAARRPGGCHSGAPDRDCPGLGGGRRARRGRARPSASVWMSSTNSSHCRRRSSATMGGLVLMVETTETLTPLRCTASTSGRKSPSPRTGRYGRDGGASSSISIASSISILPLTRRRPVASVNSLAALVITAVAVIVEPVDQRSDRRVFFTFDECREVKSSNQVAAALEFLQQTSVVHVEAELLRRRIEVSSVDEERDTRFTCHVMAPGSNTVDQ
jgi:hypothetical protein